METVYRHYGHERFDPALFEVITNIPDFVKPRGGLWACPVGPGKDPWREWCEDEGFNTDDLAVFFEFTLCPFARIFTVDGMCDLRALIRAYGRSGSFRHLTVMDFEAMAKQLDVIYLTEAGQWRTRLTNPSMYGWDVECVLILNKAVVRPL